MAKNKTTKKAPWYYRHAKRFAITIGCLLPLYVIWIMLLSKDTTTRNPKRREVPEDITEVIINTGSLWTVAHLLAYGKEEYYAELEGKEEASTSKEDEENHVLLFKNWNADFMCQPNAKGETALHLAIRKNRLGIVKVYGNRKLCLNKSANEHDTPLHYAAYFGREEAARILIDSGAYEHAKNDKGTTPRDYAVQRGHDSVVAIIDGAAKARGQDRKDNSRGTEL